MGDERPEVDRYFDRWGLALCELNRELLADVDRRLGLDDGGRLLSPSTASRRRKVSRACIRRAVELGVIAEDPWPPAPRGRSSRKAVRTGNGRDRLKALPDPVSMARVIDVMRNHQPASYRIQVMTAVAYYGGLRPSEVVMLRTSVLELPESGWGRIHVVEADVSFDEPGEPKTGPRVVPIPPVLVGMLREWIAANGIEGPSLLFRTRSGRRPSASNWCRALHRATRIVGLPRMRVYDCRHAAATTWLRARVPLGEVALRMGHSVETLVRTYVGVLEDDAEVANECIDALLAPVAAASGS
jgi:integrase